MANMANGSRYDFSNFVRGGCLHRALNSARLAIEDLIEKNGGEQWHRMLPTNSVCSGDLLPTVPETS